VTPDPADPAVDTGEPAAGGPPWLPEPPDPVVPAPPRARDQMHVTPRTIRIGYETYPLRNIARVSVQTVEWAERPPAREVGPPLGLLGLAALVLVATSSATSSSYPAQDGPRTLAFLVLAVGLIWLLVAVSRKRYRTALVVESSGQHSTALVSKDEDAVRALENEVIGAVENPPSEPRTVHIGDVVHGDKIGGNKYQRRPDEPLDGPPGGAP
jgi:hypothetical protein